MKPFSMDLRERVVNAYDRKEGTRRALALRFDVSEAWIKKILHFRRATGSPAPKPHRGGPKPKIDAQKALELKALVAAQADLTLAELRERLGVDGSIMAVFRALKRLKCRRKKSRCGPQNKIARMYKPGGKHGTRTCRN
jgi:transposase